MNRVRKRFVSRIDRLYKKIAIRSSDRVFCALFNMRSFFLGLSVRFSKTPDVGRYIVTEGRYRRYFTARSQNWASFRGGIAFRSTQLAEDYHLNLINFLDGDVVVDCGANIGDFKLYFDEKGVKISYFGFEPSLKEYECLARNVPDGRLFNVALWDTKEMLRFYVSSEHADSSVIEPVGFSQTIKVQGERLDKMVDCQIKLLKIEAEGAEPEVIRGCSGILDKTEFVSADLGFERGVSRASTFIPVTNFLLNHGFELIALNFYRLTALYKRKSG